MNSDSKYHYHYSCIKRVSDAVALQKIGKQYKTWQKQKDPKKDIVSLVSDYPYVTGIENLETLKKSEIVCYGDYPNPDKKNCKNCQFENDCILTTKIKKLTEKVEL